MSKTPPTQPPNPPLMPSESLDPMQGAVDAIQALHEKLDKDWELRNLEVGPSAPAMPVDPAVSALKEYLERFPETFKVNEQETEEDGQKAGEMALSPRS